MIDHKQKTKTVGKDTGTKVEYKIVNVVATVSMELEENLNLIEIVRKFPDSEYNPERFPGVVLRMENPRATYLIFASGKMVVTGLKDEDTAESVINEVLDIISSKVVELPDAEINIRNVVASGSIHKFIDLNLGALVLENSMYEPEVFPGLIYNFKEPKCNFLLFSTGSLVCTGARSSEDIEKALDLLVEKIDDSGIAKEKDEDEFDGTVDGLVFV